MLVAVMFVIVVMAMLMLEFLMGMCVFVLFV